MKPAKESAAKVEKEKQNAFPKFDYGVVLQEMGSFGRYQILLLCIAYYIPIPSGLNQVGSVFISAVPEYRCRIPEMEAKFNLSEVQLRKISIPEYSDKEFDGCKRYVHVENCTGDDFSKCFTNTTSSCHAGYVYDRTTYDSTIVTEWDLVCDRLILGTVTTLMYFCGICITSPIGGNLSDRFGRTRVMLAAQLVVATLGVACSYAPNVAAFAAIRFGIACATISSWEASFVYMIEIAPDRWRTPIGINIQAVFAFGYIGLSGMSYIWRDWRSLQFAIAMFSFAFPLLWIFLLESPRWLFSKGRIESGKDNSKKIAERNGRPLPDDIWKKAVANNDKNDVEHKQHLPHVLFKRPFMTIVTIRMMFVWFVIALVYYGLSLNVGSLVGDDRINNILSGVCEVLSCPLAIFTIDRFGRRPILSTSLLVSGMACIISTATNYFSTSIPALGIVGTIFAFIGKLAVSGSFGIIYNFTAELFPTVIRGTAIGVGSMSARIGSIFSPLIILMQYSVAWLPGTIFGVLSIIAGFVCLFLPETKSLPLTTTLDEAEISYTRARKWSCLRRYACGANTELHQHSERSGPQLIPEILLS